MKLRRGLSLNDSLCRALFDECIGDRCVARVPALNTILPVWARAAAGEKGKMVIYGREKE